MEKAAIAAEETPLLTLTTIFASVPTSLAVGVPPISPVTVLKLAHVGAFLIAKVSDRPAGSVALG
jgi:hypothetical protein